MFLYSLFITAKIRELQRKSKKNKRLERIGLESGEYTLKSGKELMTAERGKGAISS